MVTLSIKAYAVKVGILRETGYNVKPVLGPKPMQAYVPYESSKYLRVYLCKYLDVFKRFIIT